MGSVYGVEAFPLYWPEGWARTPSYRRDRGRYKLPFAQARAELIDELKKLGGREILISSNIPLRRDGLPYAAPTDPSDTGIAVYWTEGPMDKPRHQVLACDCWQSTASNLRAIGVSIEAIATMKRAGATQVLDQAYKGFTALPASTKRSWREVLQLGGSQEHTFEQAKAAYRLLIPSCHPDTGGTHEKMAELNNAFAEATKHFKGENGTL